MFTISARDLGKKYHKQWVFRNLNAEFSFGSSYAVLGPNGSGKSTLIQLLSGYLRPDHGSVEFRMEGKPVLEENRHRMISIAAPYLELIEELTLEELIRFHFSLVQLKTDIQKEQIPSLAQLDGSARKQIRHFSSGMKQRLRLVLAFFSDTPAVLLDEPLSHLDEGGKEWFSSLVNDHRHERLILVSSNHQQEETFFCEERFDITRFKP